MAANFLGLFFFIIGSTGISNALSLNEFFDRNKRSSYFPYRFSDEIQGFRGRPDVSCLSRFSPIACKFMKYQGWQNPYLRHVWSLEDSSLEVTGDSYESSENSLFPPYKSVQNHYAVNAVSNIQARQASESSSQSDTYSKPNFPFSSSATTNLASYLRGNGQNILTVSSKNIPAMETTSNLEHLQTIYKDSLELQHKSSSFKEKESINSIEKKLEHSTKSDRMKSSLEDDEFENSSHYLTDAFKKSKEEEMSIIDKGEDKINGSSSLKRDFSITHSTTLNTDGKSEYTVSPTETSFSEERLNKLNEENLQTRSTSFQESSPFITREATSLDGKSSSSDGIESTNNENSKMSPNDENFDKMSTVFQDSSSVITGEIVPLDDKSSSSDGIQSTSIRDSDSESTSQNPSFSITDDDISSKTISSSSRNIHPKNTQSFETESIIPQSSSTMTVDDTTFHSKFSSSFETVSTTAKILETDSTVEHFTSSKITPLSFTDKINEGSTQETFSTESASLEIHFTSGGIKQDHIIEIPSIRTARVVITSTFLVIALIALTVLAVFIFRMRRREVQYDQLMLIS